MPGDRSGIPAPADAALIALCQEALRLEAERDAYWARHEDGRKPPGFWAEIEARTERLKALREEIVTTPAASPAGLRAKATVLIAHAPMAAEGRPEPEWRWGCALAQDILRITEVPAAEQTEAAKRTNAP